MLLKYISDFICFAVSWKFVVVALPIITIPIFFIKWVWVLNIYRWLLLGFLFLQGYMRYEIEKPNFSHSGRVTVTMYTMLMLALLALPFFYWQYKRVLKRTEIGR